MYNNDEFNDEFDDEFDENAEFEGYDEEYDNEYENAEDSQIVDFSFRQLEQVGGFIDEDIGLGLGTQQITKNNLVQIDPDTKFKLNVLDVLKYSRDLQLSDEDERMIKQTISTLPPHFIRYKNATAYVYGYYLFQDLPAINQLQTMKRLSSAFVRKVDLIKRLLGGNPNLTIFEILNYAHYWKSIKK